MPQLLDIFGMSGDQIIRWLLLWLPLFFAAFRMIGYLWLDIEQGEKK